MDHPFQIAQHDRPQLDRFDEPADPIDLGDITDADLVLQNDEEAGDQVLDQGLGAEADGQAKDAGAGEDRHHIDVEFSQQHERGEHQHHRGERILHQAAERSRPLGALRNIERRRRLVRHTLLDTVSHCGDHAHCKIGHHGNRGHAHAMLEEPAGKERQFQADRDAGPGDSQRRRCQGSKGDQEHQGTRNTDRTAYDRRLPRRVEIGTDVRQQGTNSSGCDIRDDVRQQQRDCRCRYQQQRLSIWTEP